MVSMLVDGGALRRRRTAGSSPTRRGTSSSRPPSTPCWPRALDGLRPGGTRGGRTGVDRGARLRPGAVEYLIEPTIRPTVPGPSAGAVAQAVREAGRPSTRTPPTGSATISSAIPPMSGLLKRTRGAPRAVRRLGGRHQSEARTRDRSSRRSSAITSSRRTATAPSSDRSISRRSSSASGPRAARLGRPTRAGPR